MANDFVAQSERALSLLHNAIQEAQIKVALSSTSSADKRTIETGLRVANEAFKTLTEMFRQMKRMEWNRKIVEVDWFAPGKEAAGANVFRDLFFQTYENVGRLVGYTEKVDLSGRFITAVKGAKETAEEVAPNVGMGVGFGLVVALIAGFFFLLRR